MDNQYSYYHSDDNYQYGGGSGMNTPGQGRPDHHAKEPKKKAGNGVPKIAASVGCAILFGIIASAVFLTCNTLGRRIFGMSASGSVQEQQDLTDAAPVQRTSSVVTSDVSEVVDQVMPSIVSITGMSVEEVQGFFGGTYEQKTGGVGTGIIIGENDDELLIVTNSHVVAGRDTLTVTFGDENSVEANIKGSDAVYDVAVIAVAEADIPAETKGSISVARLGDSDSLKVGEPAIAIGNALGYGQSVTTGVISALNRTVISTDAQTGETTENATELIQTDAAINSGNSGGALVNVNGEVVGINSAKQVGATVEGIGYAIPISDVYDLIQSMMSQDTKTKVDEDERGMIGITGISVSDAFSQQIDVPAGVYVTEITPGGGAEAAGMTKGCIITAINGSTVDSMDALQTQLEYYAKGQTVTLTIEIPQTNGEYKETEIDVTLR